MLSLLPVKIPEQQQNNLSLLGELVRLRKSGAAATAPLTPYSGELWYDTTTDGLKYYDNSKTARTLSTGGTVTSVALSGGTTGLTVSGSPINTSGTFTLAGTLTIANGGTGQITASAAFDALSPNTTLGDITYFSTTNTRLAGNITTTKKFLRQTGTGTVSAAPAWDTIVAGDVPTLNQDTTGSAAKWTNARTLAGNSVDGSANVAFANKFIVQGTTDAGLSAAQFLGALGTGILKNTTTTGVLSIAVAGDFPTLNQSTTGSAATLTTPRNIAGVAFDGSAAISIPHANLTSLSADDHSQYALLAGRSGGQQLDGDTASGGNLTLMSTAHATKGKILFGTSAYDEANNRLGVGTASPAYAIDVLGGALATIQTLSTIAGDAQVVMGYKKGSAVVNNDALGAIGFVGSYDATHNYGAAAVFGYATETWSATLGGSKLIFATTPNGTHTLTNRLQIDQDGTLTANKYGTGLLHSSSAGVISSSLVDLTADVTGVLPSANGGQDTAAWSTFTPTWTGAVSNPAIGNGTLTGRYKQLGKTTFFSIVMTAGSSTTFGSGAWSFALPVTASSSAPGRYPMGVAEVLDSGVNAYLGNAVAFATTKVDVVVSKTAGGVGTFATEQQITSAIPFTFGTADSVALSGVYEAA